MALNENIFNKITIKLDGIYKSGNLGELKALIAEIQQFSNMHKQSDEAWQARLLYKITTEALIIIEGGIITDCMVAFEKITGYKKNELIGMKFLETVHPNNHACISDYIQKKNGKTERYKGIKKDTSLFYGEISVHQEDNNPESKYLLIRDVTDQHILEQKLRESENKFRNLANSTSVAIMIYQKEYWVYANPAAEIICGYSQEELKKLKYWSFVAPEFREVIQKRGQERQKGDDVPSGYEFKIISKDGKEKWVFLEGKLTLFNGKPAGLISIIDITHIKQIELDLKVKNKALYEKDQELQATNKQLADLNNKLEEQNAGLIAAKNKAEESDRLKSAFLANMSHEIRTPMNAIMGFAEILSESESLTETEKEFADTIYQRSHHLLSIINDIVDISKIEANLLSIHKNKFDLNHFLDELKSTFKQILQQKNKTNLDIIIEKEKGRKIIFTDKNRLEQIITNLVGNSIKYTDSGNITIRYNNLTNNKIQFTISDTGIGIPADQQVKIFDRFIMANNAISDKQEGTGLGLAIAKSLSAILGGEIWIDPNYNDGASFHFTIENLDSNNITNIESQNDKKLKCRLKDKVLMVIEDDKWNASFLHNYLQEKCATVIVCNSAEEGLKILENNKNVDIILLDIRLPGINGYEALPLFKAKKNIPVIAQTAYAFNEDRKKALESGFDDYIAKPIEGEKLLNIIQYQLTK
jgi:PAS domain S-box-containing protein